VPLRALVDHREVIAPLLSEAEWDALREQVATEHLRVVLPCCGADGFMRRNQQGTQHFAHKPGAERCELAGETLQHLQAKALIVQASQRAGYAASTEIAGEGWRADVLATRGNVRIALEVQWSFLRLDECEYRQERYARDGVRGCWFFRKPPAALVRGDTLKARRDLPLFHLVANADSSFGIELNTTLHPLGEFVMALLRGRVRYCDQAVARRARRARAVCFDVACPRCGVRSVVYAVDTRLRADCGLSFYAGAAADATYDARVLNALAQYRKSPDGRLLRMGAVRLREGVGMAQACAGCDRPFTADEIATAYTTALRAGEDAWLGRFEVDLPLDAAVSARVPHWCYPAAGGQWCDEI
jgi:hypothetical protein